MPQSQLASQMIQIKSMSLFGVKVRAASTPSDVRERLALSDVRIKIHFYLTPPRRTLGDRRKPRPRYLAVPLRLGVAHSQARVSIFHSIVV
jgi:hypothetical protein